MSIWPSPTETMGMGIEGLAGPSGLGCSGIIEGGVQIWAPARRLTRGAPPDWRDIIEGEKAVATPAIAASTARRTMVPCLARPLTVTWKNRVKAEEWFISTPKKRVPGVSAPPKRQPINNPNLVSLCDESPSDILVGHAPHAAASASASGLTWKHACHGHFHGTQHRQRRTSVASFSSLTPPIHPCGELCLRLR